MPLIRNISLFHSGFCLIIFLINQYTFSQTTAVPPAEDAISCYQTFRGSNNRHGVQLLNGGFVSLPVLKWEYTDPGSPGKVGGGEGEPAIGDIDGNGSVEIVSGLRTYIHAIDGATGSQLWTYMTGRTIYGSPCIADVNTNGSMDVIACSDKVYALNGNNGSVIWTFTPAPAKDINSSPLVADMVPGGSPEVIATCDNGKVYCLNGATGVVIWSYTVINPNEFFWASPVAGDVNGDGVLDVVTISPANMSGTGAQVIALNGNNGSVLWTFSDPGFMWDIVPQSPVIADINMDCQMEVLAPQGGDLYILNGSNGVLQNNIYNAGAGTPAVADLDGDCDLEIITGGPKVYSSNGTLIWGFAPAGGWNAKAPRVGDFDPSSPGLEIVIGNAYDTLQSGLNYLVRMYSSSGALLWGYKNIGHTCEGIALGDIDNDGCVEIIINPDCCNGRSSVLALDDISAASNCGSISFASNLAISANNYYPCVNDSISFSSGAGCATGWSWTFPGGNPASSIQQDPSNIYFDSAGVFVVSLTAQLSCGMDTSYLVIHVDSCLPTGIMNLTNTPQLLLSPNPTSGTLSVTYPKNISKGQLCVINNVGNLVLNKNFSGENRCNIDLSNLPNGIYLIRLKAEKGYFCNTVCINK